MALLTFNVFVIPIAAELDLKKAAKSVGEKSVEMIHVKDINAITGYIRGGCTAIGMKKQYVTRIDESAKTQEQIYVSYLKTVHEFLTLVGVMGIRNLQRFQDPHCVGLYFFLFCHKTTHAFQQPANFEPKAQICR